MSWKNKVIAITPFVCMIIFGILWKVFNKAHPGWVVFLLIPLMPVLLGKKKISSTAIIIIIYIVVSIVSGWWHVTWVILLLIPIVNILMLPSDRFYIKKFRSQDKEND